MRKVICCFFIWLLGYWVTGLLRPAWASDSWKSLPANTCAPTPIVSACNLTYIMEANIFTLTNIVSGGSTGIAKMIGILYQVPPVSGKDYLTYMSSKFHVPGTPTTAYAATGGVGYTSLTPVLRIWTIMRNLAYFCFAVVFVVIGIMILIRSKIDPKTTINIQNALPKIILALILVTFSYAIAGFLVDLLYVSINLLLTVIKAMGYSDIELNLRYGLANQPLIGFIFEGEMGGAITSGAAAVGNIVDSFITNMPVVGVGGAVLGFVTSGLAFLIIAIAVIWALFKAWLMLLSAYANIILGIIFSPMQLMLEAIPGQNQFESWLRNMLANILSFPAVVVMIFLGVALGTNMGSGVASTDKYSGFVPPFIGGNSQVAVQSLIGIAMILTIPKAVEMLQEVLKAPKSKWGSAWGEAVGWSASTGTPVATKAGWKLANAPVLPTKPGGGQESIIKLGRRTVGEGVNWVRNRIP